MDRIIPHLPVKRQNICIQSKCSKIGVRDTEPCRLQYMLVKLPLVLQNQKVPYYYTRSKSSILEKTKCVLPILVKEVSYVMGFNPLIIDHPAP